MKKKDEYVWTPSGTSIMERWRALGWVPPSELKEYQDKWKYYQNLPLRKLDDAGKEQYELALKKAKVARIR